VEVVQEWLHKADKDFNTAKRLLGLKDPDTYDTVCFLCQQSVEKLMKALLLSYGKPFPKTHNLEDLGRLLAEVKPHWQVNMDDLLFLTRGAVEFRYPGEEAYQEDAEESFIICQRLREEIYGFIQG
jgi:HEPN domain-containing protein